MVIPKVLIVVVNPHFKLPPRHSRTAFQIRSYQPPSSSKPLPPTVGRFLRAMQLRVPTPSDVSCALFSVCERSSNSFTAAWVFITLFLFLSSLVTWTLAWGIWDDSGIMLSVAYTAVFVVYWAFLLGSVHRARELAVPPLASHCELSVQSSPTCKKPQVQETQPCPFPEWC